MVCVRALCTHCRCADAADAAPMLPLLRHHFVIRVKRALFSVALNFRTLEVLHIFRCALAVRVRRLPDAASPFLLLHVIINIMRAARCYDDDDVR